MERETPIIQVNHISFRYEKKQVLQDISLEIPQGKITTILGQNGCGKSTLFNLMTKNLKLKQGQICLYGKDIKAYSLREYARNVAVVNQYNIVPQALTVEKLVSYGRLPYHGTKKQCEDSQRIKEALEATNLMEMRNELVTKLSGGQMQRVWIAMAIAQNTKILFLDEPTTYLDIYHQLELLKLIRKLNQSYELTVVMILHDVNQALHYSDNIIALKKGTVAFSGNPKEFVTPERMQEVYNVELTVMEQEDMTYIVTV